jgi:hypothetical protein
LEQQRSALEGRAMLNVVGLPLIDCRHDWKGSPGCTRHGRVAQRAGS